MKFLKKSLAVFLTVLTIFTACSVVMPVFAEELAEENVIYEETDTMDAVNDSEEEIAEPEIVSEIIEKREENIKHFYLSDGSFLVAQYPNPVHYQNEDGEWVDYNNALSQAEATDEQTELFGTDELYTTGNLNDNIVFAEKSNSNTLVSYENADYPVSLNYQSAKKSNIKIIEKTEETEGNDAFLTLSQVTQEVLYENVFSDVDLQYIVNTTGFKENIILKSANAQNTFTVNYNIGELTAQVVDSQTINLMSGDEIIYTITAPYMCDAGGEISYDVTMTVDKNKNGKLRVNLTADSDWLQAEDRIYPVTVDPTITTETDRSAIDSVMISKTKSTTNFSEQAEMIVGRESSEYGYCRVLVKVDLPALSKGDMIVDAELNILNYRLDYYADTTPDMQVNAHMLTEDWTLTTVNWSNQPAYSSVISDYKIFDELGSTAEFRDFNIVAAVKQWYEDPDSNYGILLKSSNESGTLAENCVKAYMYTERYNQEEDAYPQILLTYRNNKGLEDYWTYTTLSAGTAGTAYINDYTGNLVFIHGDVATTGMLMPVSLEHVYNGYMALKNAGSYPHSGRGFKLSLQQTVKTTGISDYPYSYEDGDGTVHYFYKSTTDGVTQYLDEDGLNLELKVVSSGGYTITDKSDNVMTFDSYGNLKTIADAEGRTATLTYTTAKNSSGKDVRYLKKITDGSGHVITLTYSSGEGNSSQISKITGPDGKSITYATSSGLLHTVTYPDGTKSTYTYDDEGSLLTATSADGYKLTFTYTDTNLGKRVKNVIESNESTGQKISFGRTKLNQTVIRTSGKDAVSDNSDDIRTIYQFDNYGRTISAKSYLASGTSLGVQSYNYTTGATSNATNIGMRNRVTSAASATKNINNLLLNHNYESSSNWSVSGWLNSAYTENGTTTYDSSQSYLGAKSLKIQLNSATAKGGLGMVQNVTDYVSAGTYTVSGYVKTDSLTIGTGDEVGGACVAVRIINSDGSATREYSRMLLGTTNASVDNGWQRIYLTFTVPEGATDVRVASLVYNSVGTAYFDCMQLENSNTVNNYNLIENSGFERGTTSWTGVNTTTSDGIADTISNTGTNSYKLTGDASVTKHIRQTVKVSGSEEDTYIISGYAKANSIPFDRTSSSKFFEMNVKIVYSDGTSITKRPAMFNHAVSAWQHTTGVFTLSDEDSSTDKTPVTLYIYCLYYKQANTCYFDDICLNREPVPTYTYDSNGNLISATENAESTSALGYDSNDNLTSFTNENKANYVYTYATSGNEHRLVKAVDSTSNVTYAYSYYDNGNLKAQEIKNSAGTFNIRTGIVYTSETDGIAAGAYVLKENNQHGYSTQYDYDVQSGRLNSVTDALGYTTSYTYNSNNGLLTKVESGTNSVSYTYINNNTALGTITHNGFDYGFTYDGFGNILKTTAAGKTLMTNTYQANNGSLLKSTYGNGTYLEYTYDSVGRVTKITKDGSNAYFWRYGVSGKPTYHIDYLTGRVYYYTYDSLGRLTEEVERDTGTTDYRFETDYVYNASNNLTKVVNTADGRSVTTTYTYDKINRPTKTTINSSVNYTYGYDSLGRFSKIYLNGSEQQVVVDYDFANAKSRTSTDTVTYKTTQIIKEDIGNRGYKYTYDKLGNITKITEKPAGGTSYSTKITYVYDELGQLIRENNLDLNKTIKYTYDDGGNILTKTEYAYTTGDVGDATKTVTYTYGNTWKDQLTKYDGDDITYDNIGNPLAYRDGMSFTWSGRQMKTAVTSSGTSVSYRYNADGLRSYKKVGSTKYEYEYNGDKLYYEKRGDIKFYYRYDAFGNLATITRVDGDDVFNAYVICNSRGDVEELRKSTGELYARYVYDSWGNVIHVYNASGTEITSTSNLAIQNPIRYRGYYYDAETGLYYLQSRYYDPVTGRFVNADSLVDTSDVLGFNMYAYCGNNPVNYEDVSGNFFDAAFDICSVAYSIYQVAKNPKDIWGWVGLAADVVSLAIPGFTGGGTAVRIATKADDVVDIGKSIGKSNDALDIGKAVNQSNIADNLKNVSSSYHPVFDENQSAVIKLAKEAKKTGLNKVDADTLWGWAEEYGLSNFKKANHGPMYDSYLGGTQYHMKINGTHINIF